VNSKSITTTPVDNPGKYISTSLGNANIADTQNYMKWICGADALLDAEVYGQTCLGSVLHMSIQRHPLHLG
jgi:hypothetical protein